MIIKENSRIRTEVEELFLQEMVEEDARYLIMGDDDVDAVIPDSNDNSLEIDTSSDEVLDEVKLF